MFPKAEAQKEKDEAEVQVSCPLLHGCACCRSLQPDWDPARETQDPPRVKPEASGINIVLRQWSCSS